MAFAGSNIPATATIRRPLFEIKQWGNPPERLAGMDADSLLEMSESSCIELVVRQVQGTESRYLRAIGSAEALMAKAAGQGQTWMKGS